MRVPSFAVALSLAAMPTLGDTLASQPLWTVAHAPDANAIAMVDVWRYPPRISEIVPLGLKDHGATANALDVSDKDGMKGNLQSYPNLFGLYLPDGIVSGVIDGSTYLLMANEGGTRDNPGCFSEEARAADLALDPAEFPPMRPWRWVAWA